MGGALLVLIIIVLYFLPTIIAAARDKANIGTVVVINIFLGWVVALAMSFGQTKSDRAAQTVNVYGGMQSIPDVRGYEASALPQHSAHLSPDGKYWWDGAQWRPVPSPSSGAGAPVAAPSLSCATCSRPFEGNEPFCGHCGTPRPYMT